MSEKTYDGQTAHFLATIATCMPRDMSGDIMQGWIDNPKALQKFLEGLCPEKVAVTTTSHITHTFTVLVDETKKVEDLVKEWKYDWSNDNVTSKNFPLPKGGKIEKREISLFHFSKGMTSREVIAEMDKEGYRPSTIWELLGLGISQPDLQREFTIIALGSTCVLDDGRRVARLYGGVARRYLDLGWLGYYDWSDGCRFIGVRK